MIFLRPLALLPIFLLSDMLFGQQMVPDTAAPVLLPPVVLRDSHIVKFKPQAPPQQFLSANRFAEERDGLPFTTFVITADEIQASGFVTLADVLKSAPGIRVSQPGSALLGETFLMRGLPGNQYVKVLINDVPIRSTMSPGVGIGAQLPIRQAERIEILYGPASAVYGFEACAGVVNIILKESERPLYTQADLALGKNGYNNLDLMFGGKTGRGKRIFRFSLYGSSTVRDDTDIFYNDSLYRRPQYLPFGFTNGAAYLDHPNRVSEGPADITRFAPVPHESRLFGVQLDYRGIHFSYHRTARFDHSALGLNPLSISYANSSTRIAERHEMFGMGFQAPIGRLRTNNTVSVQRFRLDNTSSALYLFDRHSAALFNRYDPSANPNLVYFDTVADLLTAGERYFVSDGLDFRVESRTRARLRRRLSLDVGLLFNFATGYNFTPYLKEPLDRNLLGNVLPGLGPVWPIEQGIFRVGLSGNLQWQGKRLTLTGGASINLTEGIHQAGFSPRLAGQYRLAKKWAAYASAARGIKDVLPFQKANRYFVPPDLADYRGTFFREPFEFFSQEIVSSAEVGTRFAAAKTTANVSFFHQNTYDLVRDGYFLRDYDLPGDSALSLSGFEQVMGLSQKMWGIQASVAHQTVSDLITINQTRRVSVQWKNELHIQFSQGREQFGHGIAASDGIRNQPDWVVQARTSWRSGNTEFTVAWFRQSSWHSGSVLYRDFYGRAQAPPERISGFGTWDSMFRFYLSKHFSVYAQFINFTNRKHAGIDATGTQDDLLFNPQQRRQFRFGINYNMN